MFLKLFSLFSKLWVGFIFLCSFAGRQALASVTELAGPNAVRFSIWGVISLCTTLLLWFVIKNFSWLKLLILSLIVVIVLAMGRFLGYVEELSHIVLFGVLGFSLMLDLTRRFKIRAAALYAFAIGALIALLDEGLQALLPWRFASLIDVGIGLISVILGIVGFYIIILSNSKSLQNN